MTKVTFYQPTQIPDGELRIAVIAARHMDRWVFCRHKARTTWEAPGGHREEGESIDETARRELWEETGATDAEIQRVMACGVETEQGQSYGMLFYADIRALGDVPAESEIGEVQLFEIPPEPLTYPELQPELFSCVQGWLNMRSSAEELWDVYDADRNLTGRLHRRGEFLAEGDYHLSISVWLLNQKGEYLLTKRAPNKGFPGMWESTGGSAIAGDDSLTAAVREVREETGLTVDPGRGKCIHSYRGSDYFMDVWLFLQDFDLADVVLQERETCDKMYASADKIEELRREGQFIPCRYIDPLLAIAREVEENA